MKEITSEELRTRLRSKLPLFFNTLVEEYGDKSIAERALANIRKSIPKGVKGITGEERFCYTEVFQDLLKEKVEGYLLRRLIKEVIGETRFHYQSESILSILSDLKYPSSFVEGPIELPIEKNEHDPYLIVTHLSTNTIGLQIRFEKDGKIYNEEFNVEPGIIGEFYYKLNSNRAFTYKRKVYSELKKIANTMYSPDSKTPIREDIVIEKVKKLLNI